MLGAKNKNLLVLPFLFGVMLILPAFNAVFGVWEFERKDENRAFKDSLNIYIGSLDKFPRDAEAYINDNFPFRSPFLDIYHHLVFNVFNISPHPDQTIIGQNGWYFKSGGEKDICAGLRDFSDEEIDKFVNEWQRRMDFFQERGIKAHWMVAPFKHNVYTEELPPSFYYQGSRRINQLKPRFDSLFPGLIIDPVAALREAKDSIKVYYKLDNHWNFKGARIASNLILDQLRADFPDAEIPNLIECTWQDSIAQIGIHFDVMGNDDLYELRQEPIFAPSNGTISENYSFTPPPEFPSPWEYQFNFTNDSLQNGIKVLFIRDSFASFMIQFFMQSFAHSTFIFDSWHYDLNEDIIEVVKPDAVIFIGLETHMDHIIEDE